MAMAQELQDVALRAVQRAHKGVDGDLEVAQVTCRIRR